MFWSLETLSGEFYTGLEIIELHPKEISLILLKGRCETAQYLLRMWHYAALNRKAARKPWRTAKATMHNVGTKIRYSGFGRRRGLCAVQLQWTTNIQTDNDIFTTLWWPWNHLMRFWFVFWIWESSGRLVITDCGKSCGRGEPPEVWKLNFDVCCCFLGLYMKYYNLQ